MAGGVSLGTAQGRVVITAETDAAEAQLNNFAKKSENLMKQVAAAFGVGFGAKQLLDAAVAADQMATAFARQTVAAQSLAGSQAQLNELLAVYDKDTGGILSKSEQLANVTQLMSVGFADSTQELDKFATAIRGISIATGRSSDMITQNLILELFSQRGQRLDQLGLEYDKVRAKADELQAADSNLTKEQAYQNAVLAEAQRKFGDLARSEEAAATGLETLQKTAKNTALTLSQQLAPAVDFVALAFSNWITQAMKDLKMLEDFLGPILHQYQELAWLIQGKSIKGQNLLQAPPLPSLTPSAAHGNAPGLGGGGPAINPNQDAIDKAISDRYSKILDIERQANADILSENASYQSRRIRSEQQYQENVAQSAADFAKSRMRAQEDYENSVLDIVRQAQARDARMAEDHARDLERMQSDSAKRLGDLQEELDRTIAQKRADSAEKLAEMAADHDEAIADKRADSADRLLDIEKDFARQQEDAARQHQSNRLEAAARLDARALFFEDRRFNDEQRKAADAHQEKVDDEKTKLQKALDNLNESYNEKLADEQKALDKSIRQANEAHQRQVDDEKEALQTRIDDANDAYTRQLADAKAADEQRLSDMAANFKQQKDREDEDQRDRMGRMADDHTAEMTQMDTEHGERITQISTHAGEERTQLDTEFQAQLTQLGEHNKAWKTAQDNFQADALSSYQDMLEEQERAQINSQVRQLKNQLLSPDLSPDEIIAINNSITNLLTALGNVGADRITLSKPGTAPVIVPGGAGDVIGAAALGLTSAGTAGASLVVNNVFTINAVPGQTAQDLYTLIDARILRSVQLAAGRL
jgi:hypothetical protein